VKINICRAFAHKISALFGGQPVSRRYMTPLPYEFNTVRANEYPHSISAFSFPQLLNNACFKLAK
jgi:hypothetical protein